jgi:hypothetical protein
MPNGACLLTCLPAEELTDRGERYAALVDQVKALCLLEDNDRQVAAASKLGPNLPPTFVDDSPGPRDKPTNGRGRPEVQAAVFDADSDGDDT